MKLSSARTETRRMIAEPNPRFFTSADLSAWGNDAIGNICIKTFCLQAVCTPINTVDKQMEYPYPTTVNTTTVVTISVKTVLTSAGISLPYVDQDLIGRVGAGTSQYKWTDWGRNILITPTPGSTVFTITPLVWLTGSAAENVEFPIPEAYHHLVPIYMTSKAFYKRRSFAAAEAYWRSYNVELQIVATTLSNKFAPISGKTDVKDQSSID